MKKLLALILALAMTLTLAACTGGETSNPDGSAGGSSSASDSTAGGESSVSDTTGGESSAPDSSTGGENTASDSTSGTVSLLASAQYPETVDFPDEDHWDDDAYDAWRAIRKERLACAEDYPENYDDFVSATMAQFLTTANGENAAYSPLNIYLALAMLAETTGGNSQAQILTLLGADSLETLRTQANALWKGNYCNDGTVTSLLASSLWLSDSLPYQQDTLDALAETYYASTYWGKMGSDEVNQALQSWLNEQTGGLLEEQASGVELNQYTVMALATTIYYKAAWADAFWEGNNTSDTFHTPNGDITCDFMNQSTDMGYYRGDQFGAVYRELTNSGGMWLILPDEGVEVSSLLTDGQVLDMIEAGWDWEGCELCEVNLSLPKFDVSADLNLQDGLEALGVTDVFDADIADFSALTDVAAVLSTATHAARVIVDEDGVEAAAYTMFAADEAALEGPMDIVDFVLDRPFLFVITSDTDTILFAGVVNQPVE
ncbi:MAG: hypothetical protein LUF28_03815 [Clostridiales bacterium]|nr:hypothetical protein [Clostridiales bacterium]